MQDLFYWAGKNMITIEFIFHSWNTTFAKKSCQYSSSCPLVKGASEEKFISQSFKYCFFADFLSSSIKDDWFLLSYLKNTTGKHFERCVSVSAESSRLQKDPRIRPCKTRCSGQSTSGLGNNKKNRTRRNYPV